MNRTFLLLALLIGGGVGTLALLPAAATAQKAESEPAAPAKPKQKASAAARPAKQCSCFEWVHLSNFGRSCYANAVQCEQAKNKGFPPRTRRGDALSARQLSVTTDHAGLPLFSSGRVGPWTG